MTSKKSGKKKSAKKSTKKKASRKSTPAKRVAQKRVAKKSAKRVATPKKSSAKKKALKKTISRKTAAARSGPRQFLRESAGSRSGGQSGDLQGLSDVESADSESVDELIEEGNAFEAGVVSGVEDAGKRGVREVRTREVPEDDVPGEYLDEE
jgi:hypothetical protein